MRKYLSILIITMLMLMDYGISQAADIFVNADGSGDFPTIQSAINAANPGNIVIVNDGIYTGNGNRNIDFRGKAITVRSKNGPVNCIIDCENKGRGFYFHSGENEYSVVDGFTITKGYIGDYSYGGGISCGTTSVTVRNCIITNNSAKNGGGGISGGHATVTNCIIRDNSASSGGGVYAEQGKFVNCFIISNTAKRGGGITIWQYGNASFTNCIISDNTSESHGGGIYCLLAGMTLSNCTITENSGLGINIRSSDVTITNSIIWDEMNEWYSSVTITYSDVLGGHSGEGNIDSDPLLAPDHWHLEADSPCINQGDPTGNYNGQTDIDGQSRLAGLRVDMGADEFSEEPAKLLMLSLIGPEEIKENSSVQYVAIGYGIDGSITDVTKSTNWSLEPGTCGSFDENGLLTTQRIENVQDMLVTTTYISGEDILETEMIVNVFVPFYLRISGPAKVIANSSAQYIAQAFYGDGSVIDVTNLTTFSLESTINVNLDPNGLLTIGDIDTCEKIIIYGQYDIAGITLYNKIPISIASLTDLEIVGPQVVTDNNQFQYDAIAHYDNGQIANVTESALWSVAPDSMANIDIGLLKTNDVEVVEDVVISCEYSFCSNTLEAFKTIEVFSVDLRYVPSDYNTIQDAIDAADYADIIIVSDGIYTGDGNRDIDLLGKAITVRSENGPDNCIIDCNGSQLEPHRGFDIVNLNDTNPVLDGFTIKNGYVDYGGSHGGGVNCKGNLTIKNCIIKDNYAKGGGGGVYCYIGDFNIINSLIIDNKTDGHGGGIDFSSGEMTMTNCTMVRNSAPQGAGICVYQSDTIIQNSILWNNPLPSPPPFPFLPFPFPPRPSRDIYQWNNVPQVTINCSDVWGLWPGTGNIYADPLFVDPNNDDFHLLPSSPCIDAAKDAGVYLDIENNTRPWDYPGVDNNGPDILDFDIGTYEYVPMQLPMKFTPQTLNCNSKGKWIKASFTLPEGFTIEDVDANTPAILEPFAIESSYIEAFLNSQGVVEVEIAFDRQDFCQLTPDPGPIEVTALARLTDGQYYVGSDTIRIIDNPMAFIISLTDYWLQTDCAPPNWCDGSDLNQDSFVNLEDFSLYDN